VAVALTFAAIVGCSSACSRDVDAMTPQQLQAQYGITSAYAGQVTTADGVMQGTLVPVTLADGSRAELFIPSNRTAEPHPMYFRDRGGLHPVAVQPNVAREQIGSAPVVVERRAEVAHPKKRSWEKELLIVGGSAGAGAAVGALTGGKKGAGIGAAAGGVGGLIYDLATRHKK
jgi:hypothetical protein